mgnify:FL=1
MPGFFKRSKKNKHKQVIERVSSSKRNNMLIEQKYVDCVKIYCPQKKTKRKGLFKSSTKVVCNKPYLKECIDGVKREPIYKVVSKKHPVSAGGTYHVGNSQNNNGTYTSIKKKTIPHMSIWVK